MRWHRTATRLCFCGLALTSTPAAFAEPSPHRVQGDLVKSARTAIAIAKAVAEETYGTEGIAAQTPFLAVKRNGTWHVQGHLPPDWKGGVVEVWIASLDGRVLRMTHGK